MGLTSSSTGNLLISSQKPKFTDGNSADYIVGLAGNPNVR